MQLDQPCLAQDTGSFRDPSGYVYIAKDSVFRTISPDYSKHWNAATESGFTARAIKSGLLLDFAEVPAMHGAWKTLECPRLPFISYPYEWCFSQLKDAAKHTLNLMGMALEDGLILKDASAYNMQFMGTKSTFIDHLSFEIWQKNSPWVGYLQFCKHFLAPLALMSKNLPECGILSANWIDGIPLHLASSLLPFRTKLSLHLNIHIHVHARMQQKYSDARASAEKVRHLKVSEKTVPRLCESLRACLDSLTLPRCKTEWGDYYDDTNYTKAGETSKAEFVRVTAARHSGAVAFDIGANTGAYSRLLAEFFPTVIAVDMDHMAVEKMYLNLKKSGQTRVMPLLINLSNPTPALGWMCQERQSFIQRSEGDYVSALALIHHLVLTAGIPLAKTADFFASLLRPSGVLVLEFVPFEDSQVQRMLAARETVFKTYSLETCLDAYAAHFELLERKAVAEITRTLLVLKKK